MHTVSRHLHAAGHQVRLLRLNSARDFNAPLRCQLLPTSLWQAPSYEALSYNWGTAGRSKIIELESAPVAVTPNLEIALRYLRKPSAERLLWVDALCINYDDAVDRSKQASILRHIYRNCSTNVVWLGPTVPGPHDQWPATGQELARGLNLMRQICSRDLATLENMRDVDHYRKSDEGNHSCVDEVVEAFHETAAFRREQGQQTYLVDINESTDLYRPFQEAEVWNQTWAVQQIAHAPRVVLQAADKTLEWDTLASFLEDEEYSDAFHLPWAHGIMEGMVCAMFEDVKAAHTQRKLTQLNQADASSEKSSLMSVLTRFKQTQAADPRDKIYGVLGFLPHEDAIKIDYTKTVSDIYSETTVALIDANKNLDIICQNLWHLKGKSSPDMNLPSWVPDFSRAGDLQSCIYQYQSLFSPDLGLFASGKPSCTVPCRVVNGKALQVSGTVVGRVGCIKRQDPSSTSSVMVYPSQLPRDWMRMWFGEGLLGDDQATYAATGESCRQAFSRTLAFDCQIFPMKRLNTESIKSNTETIEQLLKDKVAEIEMTDTEIRSERTEESKTDENRYHRSWDRLMSEVLRHHIYTQWMFFVSENGLYVMARDDVREGDLIAVLDGAKVPIALRSTGGGEYSIISHLYVHGYMDGMAEEQIRDGLLTKREFLIV
ncbi:hypothetical protein NQ176_g1603 [Zarea fungicola]|uniref:Uncharacterized protein n=1 Tax=Zarea fungicola TaxID=93591 RepID=A0ACC1NSN0_9HYPO|nr:hypothetical protein NQ176_g1603 [Lecanicillium fungicola]